MKKINEDIQRFLNQGKNILTVLESKQLLRDAGFPVNRFALTQNVEEAIQKSESFGYPVVMKIVSSDIVHKSDIGGVAVGVESAEKVKEKYNEMIDLARKAVPDAKIDGILVEEMIQDGIEIILGSVIDPVFEHVAMFGLGGIFVEVLKDVTFRLIPMDRQDALEMLNEIRAAPILDGVRGQRPVDKNKLVDLIMRLSNLISNNKEITECDLNPVFAGPEDSIVVDARLVLKPWKK